MWCCTGGNMDNVRTRGLKMKQQVVLLVALSFIFLLLLHDIHTMLQGPMRVDKTTNGIGCELTFEDFVLSSVDCPGNITDYMYYDENMTLADYNDRETAMDRIMERKAEEIVDGTYAENFTED